jgi:hypothetical protein
MLTVEKADSRGRDEMEVWFHRAMEADGNNVQACRLKLDWLDPKWHGTEEEMLAFGRACRATGNWRIGMTLLVAEAHDRVRWALPTNAERMNYVRRPEVWADVYAVYPEYLKHYPFDYGSRSRYAAYCYLGGQYAISHQQFMVVGEHLWSGEGFDEQFMKQARAYVAKKAAEPPLPAEAEK